MLLIQQWNFMMSMIVKLYMYLKLLIYIFLIFSNLQNKPDFDNIFIKHNNNVALIFIL